MVKTYDYIVVGAGVNGCATAYYLQKNNPNARILLLEKNHRVGLGNTSKSAALYRTLFSSPINHHLAASSIAYYQTIAQQIHLKNIQYLWLLSKQQWKQYQKQQYSTEISNQNHIFSSTDLESIISINPSVTFPAQPIYKGILCQSCGSLSAVGLTIHYAQSFQKLGGEIQLNTQIQQLQLTGKKTAFAPWDTIELDTLKDTGNRQYKAKQYIFTIGAWTPQLLLPIGIYPGSLPKKRQLFGIKQPPSFSPYKKHDLTPALILPTAGIYVKPIPQQKIFLVGCADDLGQPYFMDNPEPDEIFYHNAIQPIISQYFPKLRYQKPQLKWAGYYSYHLPDKHPIIEKIANITWVCGTSGSGIMKADAIGRITSARVLNQPTTLLRDNTTFQNNILSLSNRDVPNEHLII
jgi:glycine/D-amino acid oxidase-like deaminating enzyme